MIAVLLYGVGAAVVANRWFGIELTLFLGTSAVVGAVVGLALQDSLGNLFAGIALHTEAPFRVGDWVKVGDRDGKVEQISWLATRLRTWDGDTLTVMVGNKRKTVRLIGSEAPHLTHSVRGKESRDFLGRLVRGKAIRLEIDSVRRDPSKRLRAYVYAGDVFVNLELIRQGQAAMAKGSSSLKYADEYRKAQMEAQEAGRGIWETKHLLK